MLDVILRNKIEEENLGILILFTLGFFAYQVVEDGLLNKNERIVVFKS
jgi:hypothetical protein